MKTMNLSKRNFLCSLFSILCAVASAQSAFQPGEQLEYSLYYNWSFVWVKAGTATLTIKNSTYNGNAAYLTRLLMRGSKKADGYFVLRDTLTSYVKADNLQPLYYAKRDIEGKKRKKREVWYSYQGNNCRARQQYTHSSGRVTNMTRHARSRFTICSALCSRLVITTPRDGPRVSASIFL